MAHMARLALSLLEEYGIQHVPVPLEPLLERNNILVTPWSFPRPWVGMSHRGKHRNFIAVHRGLGCEARRHVITHEAAHILLHSGNQFYMAQHPLHHVWVDRQEWQADTFAAHFLIPEWELQRVGGMRPDELADHFLVPESLVVVRMRSEQ
ncbi:MAG: ImmA/IrrE family metallo-endopeptidase [Bacillota bacterium]